MPAGIYLDEMLGPAVERRLQGRLAPAGWSVVRAGLAQPADRDSALLAYAAAHQLVLTTRNVRDFIRLNEQWTALRDWGLLPRPHGGILIPLGLVSGLQWTDTVADLVLHPNCPALEDHLYFWHAAPGQWESDHSYARQRRRPVGL